MSTLLQLSLVSCLITLAKYIVSVTILPSFLNNCLFLNGVALLDDGVFVGPLGSPCYIVYRLALMYLDNLFPWNSFFLIDDLIPADISNTVSNGAGEVSF